MDIKAVVGDIVDFHEVVDVEDPVGKPCRLSRCKYSPRLCSTWADGTAESLGAAEATKPRAAAVISLTPRHKPRSDADLKRRPLHAKEVLASASNGTAT